MIASLGLEFDTTVEFTKNHKFDFVLGAYYKKYLKHPKLDSSNNFATLTPDTELNFEMNVANFTINVYDNLTFKASPLDALIPKASAGNPRVGNITGFNADITLYPRFLNITMAFADQQLSYTKAYK